MYFGCHCDGLFICHQPWGKFQGFAAGLGFFDGGQETVGIRKGTFGQKLVY